MVMVFEFKDVKSALRYVIDLSISPFMYHVISTVHCFDGRLNMYFCILCSVTPKVYNEGLYIEGLYNEVLLQAKE